jgi:hypothetical protein
MSYRHHGLSFWRDGECSVYAGPLKKQYKRKKYSWVDDTQAPEQELSPDHTKKLARLVGKYGDESIATTAFEVLPQGPGRPSSSKPPVLQSQELSTSDARVVCTLVRKYGARAIGDCARRAPKPRRRGRPFPGRAYYERLHLTDCIKGWEQELSESGDLGAKKKAEWRVYYLLYGSVPANNLGTQHLPAFDEFRKQLKSKLQRGLKDWDQLAHRVQQRPDLASIMRITLPHWLVARIGKFT